MVVGGWVVVVGWGLVGVVVVGWGGVVLPFVFMQNSVNAFRLSQGITLAMLFPAGTAFGRYAEHPKPMRTGIAISVFGAVPIAVVKALGR